MSATPSITSALKTFSPLLNALQAAYWDSSTIEIKDRIFDLVTCVHAELNELAKLSVSDLDMPYETITPEFAGCCQKMSVLMNNLDEWFPRSSTHYKLKTALPDAASLITSCVL